jgi:hypothetical protein
MRLASNADALEAYARLVAGVVRDIDDDAAPARPADAAPTQLPATVAMKPAVRTVPRETPPVKRGKHPMFQDDPRAVADQMRGRDKFAYRP